VKEYFEAPGDHADEMETSVMLHLHPELIMPLAQAGDGSTLAFSSKGFKQGWAWTQRPWTLITKDTGSGNPALANAEKGSKFLDAVTHQIAEFFSEICGKSLESLLH
jgi:creatinine amidohydrolase